MSDFGDFDARQIEPSVGGGGPIPAGDYRAVICKSGWKKTKDGGGEYMEFVFEVVAGEQKGARVWVRLNLRNKSTVAKEIAQKELSAICHAVGNMRPQQSQELHSIPMVIGVGLEERKDKPGHYSNRVTKYESIESAAPVAAAATGGEDSPF